MQPVKRQQPLEAAFLIRAQAQAVGQLHVLHLAGVGQQANGCLCLFIHLDGQSKALQQALQIARTVRLQTDGVVSHRDRLRTLRLRRLEDGIRQRQPLVHRG